MGKAITPQVMPKTKPAKPHDTEAARIAATNIITWHRQAEAGAKIALSAAVMIGTVMLNMKAQLPHGSFIRWQDKYLKPIPLRTRTMYMGLVKRLGKDAPAKLATVANLLPATVQEVTEREIKSVSHQVHDALDGKQLSELYREYGLVKQRQTKGVKLDARRKRVALDTGKTGGEVDAHLWYEETMNALQTFRVKRASEFIDEDMLNKLAHAIVDAWSALGLPPIVQGGGEA